MTPELAQHILEQDYNENCYDIIQNLYQTYDVKDIQQAIARYRAQKTLAAAVDN